jgi:fructan beta-fructosidase
MIFSGSVVVDRHNTSSFGTREHPAMVACYTANEARGIQSQALAYSTDRGRTWAKYSGNPVLDLGMKDFRDPKVFWHEPTARWVMIVSLAHEYRLQMYGSTDLKAWTHLSDFGPLGATTGIWECPDLLRVPVLDREGEFAWMLKVDVFGGYPSEGTGAQIFVGDFDGVRFTLYEGGGAPPSGSISVPIFTQLCRGMMCLLRPTRRCAPYGLAG